MSVRPRGRERASVVVVGRPGRAVAATVDRAQRTVTRPPAARPPRAGALYADLSAAAAATTTRVCGFVWQCGTIDRLLWRNCTRETRYANARRDAGRRSEEGYGDGVESAVEVSVHERDLASLID